MSESIPIPGNPYESESRTAFVNELVQHNLITEEFASSGLLNRFLIYPQTDDAPESDALIHTLVGGHDGGFHHLQTALELGMVNRTVASKLGDLVIKGHKINEAGVLEPVMAYDGKTRRERVKHQRVKDQGHFKALHVEMPDETGKPYPKEGGSSMFPVNWTTEQVLKAIISVSQADEIEHNEKRGIKVHEAIIEGVPLRVITDDETGKIMAGFPKR